MTQRQQKHEDTEDQTHSGHRHVTIKGKLHPEMLNTEMFTLKYVSCV